MNKLQSFLLVFVITALGFQAVCIQTMITRINQQTADITRLQSHQLQFSRLIDNARSRLTRLERPDEPVYPPRNPGRLGTIDSSKVGSIDP